MYTVSMAELRSQSLGTAKATYYRCWHGVLQYGFSKWCGIKEITLPRSNVSDHATEYKTQCGEGRQREGALPRVLSLIQWKVDKSSMKRLTLFCCAWEAKLSVWCLDHLSLMGCCRVIEYRILGSNPKYR